MNQRGYLSARQKWALMRSQGWRCGCGCNAPVWPGGPVEYDHTLPLALGGSQKPDSALTRWCHAEKTKQDVRRISKADRQGRAHLGLKRRKGRAIPSRPFPKAPEGFKHFSTHKRSRVEDRQS